MEKFQKLKSDPGLMNTTYDENTRLILVTGRGPSHRTEESYYGPAITSSLARGREGSPQWIDHIFVSEIGLDEAKKRQALKAAITLSETEHAGAMGSSRSGLNATLHVVEKPDEIETFEVTYMTLVNPDQEPPVAKNITAWASKNLMKPKEIKAFNEAAKDQCAGSAHPHCKRIKELK